MYTIVTCCKLKFYPVSVFPFCCRCWVSEYSAFVPVLFVVFLSKLQVQEQSIILIGLGDFSCFEFFTYEKVPFVPYVD
jgi:hypothetical protein